VGGLTGGPPSGPGCSGGLPVAIGGAPLDDDDDDDDDDDELLDELLEDDELEPPDDEELLATSLAPLEDDELDDVEPLGATALAEVAGADGTASSPEQATRLPTAKETSARNKGPARRVVFMTESVSSARVTCLIPA